MGELLYGKPGKYFNSIMTMVYLFAILMSKTIIIGTIMSGIFGSTIILGNYYFWISLFVIICGIMSLRNVAALAKIQNVFVIIRYFLITIMILGCIVIICQNGPYPLMPTFKLSKFADIYGTSIFCYMLHTSIP